MDIHAVVGAPDPERAAIIHLLEQAGIPVHYAAVGESMVHPGNAYQADRIAPPLPPDCHVWRIECDGPAFADISPSRITVIDHHRPGDPGYGRPPWDFLAASSIGQVVAELARVGRLPQHDYESGWIPAGRIDEPDPLGFIAPSDDLTWTVTVGDGYSIISIPSDIVYTAAADHCLAAAYRGECPGVDPDTLMRHLERRSQCCIVAP